MVYFLWLIFCALLIEWTSVHSVCEREFDDDLRYKLRNKNFPWNVVVINRSNTSTNSAIFMGTLISPRVILTTATDILDLMSTDPQLEVFTSRNSSQKYKVVRSIPRDWYNRIDYDIGLHLLDSPVNINAIVFPVCMDYIPVLSNTDIGYGEVLLWTYDEHNTEKGVLAIIPVRTYPVERCREKDEPLDKTRPYCVKVPGDIETKYVKYGNKGAALVISHFGKYYVKAIWSGQTDETLQYWSFADLQPHIEWIKKTALLLEST